MKYIKYFYTPFKKQAKETDSTINRFISYFFYIGLMITAYAKAASALNVEEYKQRAIQAAEFLETYAWDSDTNILLRSSYVNENGDIANM